MIPAWAWAVFLRVPDADCVVCRDGTDPPLASAAFVRYCHSAWEIVFTSGTLGEFVDRLGAFDPGLLFHTFGPRGLVRPGVGRARRDDPFGGASEVAGHGFPMAEGEREPYASWHRDMPAELYELSESVGVPWRDPATVRVLPLERLPRCPRGHPRPRRGRGGGLPSPRRARVARRPLTPPRTVVTGPHASVSARVRPPLGPGARLAARAPRRRSAFAGRPLSATARGPNLPRASRPPPAMLRLESCEPGA